MIKQLLVFAVAALVGTALSALDASAQNLLDNPGFESPFAADGAPFDDNWEAFSGGAGATSAAASAEPRTGAQHLSLDIVNTNNTFAGVFQDVPVAAGQSVTFGGWNKTISSPLDLGAEFRIEWRSASAEVSRTANILPTLGSDYTPFSLTAAAPAGAVIARVVYAIQTFGPEPTNTGTVYVDDVSVTAVPEPASAGLIGVAALGLLRLARRNRNA
jgi:hypothetical protein